MSLVSFFFFFFFVVMALVGTSSAFSWRVNNMPQDREKPRYYTT